MLGSLYHFHPREADVLCRMAASAPRALLLEPVENLNQSASTTVRLLSGAATYIGGTRSSYRLDSARLDAVLAQAGVPVYRDRRVLDGRYRLVEFGRSPDSTRTGERANRAFLHLVILSGEWIDLLIEASSGMAYVRVVSLLL
jgi:hypothetical protein